MKKCRAEKARKIVLRAGEDILASERMQSEKNYIQHAEISCYDHSFSVAKKSVEIALALGVRADLTSLARGALLHDYFLYDWHEKGGGHRLHGFRHAGRALKNASRDFELNAVERDIIAKHMFPLNLRPPRYRESLIVSVADKLCAVSEIFVSRK